jgi:hypothetical protein
MNRNWKISTSSIKSIKSKKNTNLKKGVIIKYIPYTNPKFRFNYSPVTEREFNLKEILDFIKMRIEFLKIEHACVYEPDTGNFVSACCICRDKINNNNYVCTSTSCISEFLKEITDDNTHLSKKYKDYEDYDAYDDKDYDYDDYDAYDNKDEELEQNYCGCLVQKGYKHLGACDECGTRACGRCIDVCRCYNYD